MDEGSPISLPAVGQLEGAGNAPSVASLRPLPAAVRSVAWVTRKCQCCTGPFEINRSHEDSNFDGRDKYCTKECAKAGPIPVISVEAAAARAAQAHASPAAVSRVLRDTVSARAAALTQRAALYRASRSSLPR